MSLAPVIQFMNATTASPNFVSYGLNPDGRLALKARSVLLWDAEGQMGMAVIRESSAMPGAFSADVRRLNCGAWEWWGKVPYKYTTPADPPPGAYHVYLDGIRYSTMWPMTQAEQDQLRTLSRAPTKGRRPQPRR